MTRCKHGLISDWCADCLGIPPANDAEPSFEYRTSAYDPDGWLSADVVVKQMERDAERLWTPELVGIEDLMSRDADRVGGIVGLRPEYHTVRAGLIELGSKEGEPHHADPRI